MEFLFLFSVFVYVSVPSLTMDTKRNEVCCLFFFFFYTVIANIVTSVDRNYFIV